MTNFLQVNRALGAEKNFYLNLNQLASKTDGGQSCDGNRQSRVMSQSGCSAVDVPMTSYGASDEHPMSIRSASDGGRWKNRGWKYAAMMALLLTLACPQVWGADFTAGEVVRGKTAGNIVVSTSTLSHTNGKTICNNGSAQKDSAIQVTGEFYANSSYSYVEIKAATDYKLSSLQLKISANGTSAGNFVVLCYKGDSAAGAKPDSVYGLAAKANNTAYCDSLTIIKLAVGTRKVRIARRAYINNTTGLPQGTSTGSSTYGSTTQSNIFSISATAEAEAAANTYKIKGDWDSWTEHTMTVSAGVASYSLSLAADTRYEFCFMENSTAYKNNGAILAPVSNWDFNTSDNNAHIHTGPAGTYTFTMNTSNHKVSVTYPDVTHPSDHYVYFRNASVWGTVYAYLANSGNDNKAAAWPGCPTPTTTICNETYHYAAMNSMSGTYNLIIFNNGGSGPGNQSWNLSTTGSAGNYNANVDANWYDPSYEITFDANGGSGTMNKVVAICSGADQTLPDNTFTRTGWEFDGWNTNKYGTGTSYDDGDEIENITADIKLYAQWKKTVYLQSSVSWWYNDNAWFAVYCFDSDADTNNKWVKMTRAEECSSPAVYKVTLPGNGFDKVIFCRMNAADTETLAWSNKDNQTENIAYPTTNDKFTISNGDNGQACTGSWGTYSAPTYTISYDKGSTTYTGGNTISGSKDSETKTCGVDFTLPSSAVFTTTGYTQTGWATSDGGSSAYDLGDDYTTNSAQTFYPAWTVQSFTLTWDLQGGTVTTAGTGAAVDATGTPSSSVNYGTSLTAPVVAKAGYDFSAWSPAVASTMPASNTTYTATWTEHEYNITYKDGGNVTFTGNHMPDAPTTHTYNSSTTLKKASKAGYVFGGWYTKSDCSEGLVTSLGATDYTTDITLYAKWTAMTLTALENETQYRVSDMVPDGITVGATKLYYPGVSANNRFNLLGTGTSDATTGPMGSQIKGQTKVGGTNFTEYFDFRGAANVSSYVPSSRAIEFKIGATGKLEIWVMDKTNIYLSDGSSETLVSANNKVLDVSAGTYYLYAKGSSDTTGLCALRFKETYTVTYNKNDEDATGSVTDSKSPYTSSSTVTLKEPGDLELEDHIFVGWNTKSDGSGTYYSPGANFTISQDTTLYAQWRSTSSTTCPNGSTEGTVFSLSMGSTVTDSDESFAKGVAKNLSTYATITNGAASFSNNASSNGKAIITKDSPNLLKFNGDAAMLALYLDCPLADGDVISYTGGDGEICFTATTSRVTTIATSSKSLTISTASHSSIIGKNVIYIWRVAGSTYGLSALTITRPVGCTDPSASLSDESYTIGGSSLDLRTLWSSSNTTDGVTFSITSGTGTIAGDGYTFSSSTAGSVTISASQTSTGDYCDAAETATITVSNPTYTVTYTTTGSTGGSAPTDSNSPYESGSTVTVLGNTGSLVKTGYVFLGWSDGNSNNYAPGETFTISANTTLSPIWKEGTSATVTYTLATGNVAWSASGASSETTGIPNAGVTITTTNAGISGNGAGEGAKARTSKLTIATGANGATYDSPTNYILYNFSVAAGYAFTPSDIAIKVANIGSKSKDNIKYKAVLSDGTHSISTTYIVATQDGTVETFHLYNKNAVVFEGDVELKIWAWTIEDKTDGGSGFRFGSPLTIAGVTESTGYVITNGDPSGGTIAITDGSSAITSSAAGETVHIAATPSTGYGFTSWDVYKTGDASTKVSLDVDDDDSDNKTRTFTMPAYGVTVNATFTGIVYTVTLNTNGGTINEGNVTSYRHGEGATLPTDVTKDDYRFMGWYDNSGLTGSPVEEIGTSEYGDKEYWAKWAELYTITTGTHTYGSIAITNSSSEVITEAIEGETVSIAATGGVHYALSEWSIYKTSDESDVTGSVSLSDDDASPATFTMPAYGVTVNASFAIESLTLAYEAGGATGSAPTSPAAGSIDYGTVITVPDKGGYAKSTDAFVGWLYNGTTLYTTGQKFTMTEDVTLTAVWNSDCPASGTSVYKFQVSTGLTAGNINKSKTDASEYMSTLEGGTIPMSLYSNGHVKVVTDSILALTSTNAESYLKPTLTSGTFKYGDLIKYRTRNSQMSVQVTSAETPASTDIKLPVGNGVALMSKGMVGQSALYLKKAGSSESQITYFEVYRPSELIFFAEVNDGVGTSAIGSGTDETEQTAGAVASGNNLSYISGGRLYTKARSAGYVKGATNEIQLTDGDNGTYIKIALSKVLAEGDIILINSSTDYAFGITTSATRSVTICTKTYTIPAESGMIGESTIYLWKNSSNTNLRTVAVVRPNGGGSDCKFDVSFANESGFAGEASLPSTIEGVPTGKKIAQPADPTTTGDYVFGGWFRDAACANAFDFSGTITKDTTLYAKWYAADYTITWMVDGGTYATTKACDDVTTIVLPTAPADNTLDDCADSFRGWTATNLYGASGQSVPTDLFVDAAGAPTINKDTIFYAVFGTAAPVSATSFTSTFNSKSWGGDGKWTSGKDGTNYTSDRGVKVETGATGANATTNAEYKAVTSVVVTYSTNASAGAGSIEINVGGTAMIGSADITTTGGTTDRTITYTPISALDGKVKITVNTTTNSIYIKSVQISHSGSFKNYRCICPSLEVTPELVTANTPIFITSSASASSKTVRSQDRLHIVGTGLDKNATLSLSSPASKFVLKSESYEDLKTDEETGEIDTYAYIFYTPDAGDTSDGLDKYSTFTVTDGTNEAEVEQALIGRHLPADFVIAVKRNNKWYALPATMDDLTNPSPVEIAVDDIDNPTVAYTATTNIYNLYGQNSGAGYLEEDGQYVKFGMKNNGNKPLFGAATGSSTIKGDGTATVTNDIGQRYWWLLTQTKTGNVTISTAQYSISCANNTAPFILKENNGNPLWGFYTTGSVGPIRIIPASSTVVFAEAEIVAWGKNSAIVEVDNSEMIADYAIAKLPEDIESEEIEMVQTRTSVKGTGTRYNYTMDFGVGVDFSANDGKMLTLEWYDASDELKAISNIIVPCIVAEDITINSTNYSSKSVWNKEVHVLPGVTVTVDADYSPNPDVTIKELVIYPGAKVVAEGGTLKATTLVLRNGWNRLTAETEYNVSQLYITPTTGNLQATNAYADWYIDYDQYYPIAVPWKVATNGITYRNTSGAASDGVMIRYYDGEGRATYGARGANWVNYTWGVDMPANLEPCTGYAITARRPAGKAFSIVRMPLTIPSAAWTTAGEQGDVTVEAVTTHKDQVAVTAWAKNDGTTPKYAKGWNFVANPYMSSYEGELSFAPDDPGVDEDEIAYVNIPDVTFQEFEQVAAETAELKPGCGFLIQTEYDGTLTFGTAHRKADAPAYRKETSSTPKQKAYILLSSDDAVDQMGLIIADRYTADYEVNADLEKLLSDGNTLRTYMQYNNLNMAYVAINSTLAQEWIPVSVRIPAAGEYTYSLHRASRVGELEGLYLIDYLTNEVTNLIENDYVFTATAGTITDRFALNAIYGSTETPTAMDVVLGGGDLETDHPVKFIYKDMIYIYYRGVIYDTNGKKVAERRAAL